MNRNDRIKALRECYLKAPEEFIELPNGEKIYGWGLVDGSDDPIDIDELAEGQIEKIYDTLQEWNVPV